MIPVIYAAIAVAFLIVVLGLFKKTRTHVADESLLDNRSAPGFENGNWLHLSERIFDPSDARWLAEELGLPDLANALVFERKRLAILWLVALRASFDQLVRTPDFSPSDVSVESSDGSWKMLWQTVRFKVSISYAMLVVRLFGPYHRLIPSFSWVPLTRAGERSFRRPALANNRSSR